MQSVILLDVDKSDAKTTSIHLLPCHIEYDGEAAIETFFNVEKETDEGNDPTSLTEKATVNTTYRSTFRGRGLKGVEVKVPQGYEGIIFREAPPPPNINSDRLLKIGAKFTSFTTWGHGDVPDRTTDDVWKAMAWLEVATDLHKVIVP